MKAIIIGGVVGGATAAARLRRKSEAEEYDETYDRLFLSPGAEPVRSFAGHRLGAPSACATSRIGSASCATWTRPSSAAQW